MNNKMRKRNAQEWKQDFFHFFRFSINTAFFLIKKNRKVVYQNENNLTHSRTSGTLFYRVVLLGFCAIFSKVIFKFFNFQNNLYREFFYARNRLRELPDLENASLTLIQGRDVCIEAKIG
jgi:hypothetical protein